MRHYNVYLEVDGSQVRVGEIEGNSSEDAQFFYSKEYIARKDSRAIRSYAFSSARRNCYQSHVVDISDCRRNYHARSCRI